MLKNRAKMVQIILLPPDNFLLTIQTSYITQAAQIAMTI